MKRLTTLLMTFALMSTMLLANETITVSANSSDISEGLDLKVVAKLFAEAKNLEEFETMLNNPDSAFCNLDLNGDGQVDYLRVVETGEGSSRLVVLQAILAKDIYQDVASIYVQKDESNNVTVQIVGDEYVYGTNYIIEPVYVYRPIIYDWFWSPGWYAWTSPWYWGYYPNWWYVHNCWAHDWYWRRCYAWHHHHHYCSFRPGHHIHHGYHEMYTPVARRDYAVVHPDRSFSRRNEGMTNAREIRRTSTISPRQQREATASRQATPSARAFGSANTAVSRSANTAARSANTATRSAETTRSTNTATATRGTNTATRSTNTVTRSTNTATRSTNTATRSTNTATRSTNTATRSTNTVTRSTNSGTATRSTNTVTRSSSNTSSSSRGTYSQPSRTSSSSSTRSSGTYSSGGSRSGGGGYSGGSRSGGGGGGSRGGGSATRR